ncbi:MAG: DUF1653 domain-containing protein [Candidatus Magasanikbacteria bacterium]|nr:DUF1653 domain-containing protein [Candidatus Magasanikbacteria bacterium]
MNPIPGIYRHYTGKEYQVLCTAKHSETLEDFVVYKTLYPNEISDIWVRPLEMFCEEVEIDGKKIPRFKFIKAIF